ncbi:MAG: hypothetical protein WDZ59_12600 [Pirellulales bacterium]
MASGNTLVVFTPLHNEPPASNYATLALRNERPILVFDKSTDQSAIFSAVLPRQYEGNGLTVLLVWASEDQTTNDVVWTGAFERIEDDTTGLDSDNFASAKSVAATTASVAGETKYSEIAFANGSEIANLAAGEAFRLKVTRDADHGSDLMDGNAQLLAVEVRET